MRSWKLVGAAGAIAWAAGSVFGQASLTSGGYSENFDSMGAGTAGTVVPAGWGVLTLPGSNSTFTASIPAASVAGGTAGGAVGVSTAASPGNNNNGYNYAFASAINNRMLATAPTTIAACVVQLTLRNDTGAAVSGLNVAYDCRVITALQNNELPGYRVFVSVNGAAGPFTSVGTLDAVPTTGDAVGATITRSASIVLPAPVAPGANVTLRFVDDNAIQSSPDQVVAVDNVTISAAVLTSGACCLTAGGCAIVTGGAASCAGTYQGDHSVCVPDPCPLPPGTFAALAPAGYAQDFNALGAAGTTPPLGWSIGQTPGDNATWSTSISAASVSGGAVNSPPAALGVFTQAGTTAASASNNGYNLGFSTSPSDRALGTSPTTIAGSFAQLVLQNQTGGALTQVNVSYRAEVASAWNSNELPGYRVFYSTTGASGTFVPVASLDAVVSSADAVGSGLLRATTLTFAAPVPVNGYLWLRFVDDNAAQSSPDQTYAIDDVIVSTGAIEVGACCLVDGACTLAVDAAGCSGVFQGTGTACEPNPCPQPSGACCTLATGACAITTPSQCTTGVFQLAGVCDPNPCPQRGPTRFAVIGDYGVDNGNQLAVANAVKAFQPDFITTTGDNTYFTNADITNWDRTQAKYYAEFIKLPAGSAFLAQGAAVNNFFPIMGNHDFDVSGTAAGAINSWNAYWDLPGNERYYTFTRGPIDFFMLSSDGREPDANAVGGTQFNWFTQAMAQSTSTFKLVFFHHPAYTYPSNHGPDLTMRGWNFGARGVTAVLNGHNHNLQRINAEGISWFVSGAAGQSLYSINGSVAGGQFAASAFGFLLVDAYADRLEFRFVNTAGQVLDTSVIAATTGACCAGTACAVSTQAGCVGAFAGVGVACGPVGNPTTCCPANYNGQSGITVQDIFDFLAGYFAGSPQADINASGGLTVQDIFDFLSAYFAGC